MPLPLCFSLHPRAAAAAATVAIATPRLTALDTSTVRDISTAFGNAFPPMSTAPALATATVATAVTSTATVIATNKQSCFFFQ